MASTESVTKLSGVLASLSETLVEFRSESAEIESQFFELFDGMAELTASAEPEATSAETTCLESTAVVRLENLDRSINEQREEFSDKQDQLQDDVGQLRELVDRQTQLFAALISSTSKPKRTSSRKGTRKNSSEDEVLKEVFTQFEALRGAAAAASEVSTT